MSDLLSLCIVMGSKGAVNHVLDVFHPTRPRRLIQLASTATGTGSARGVDPAELVRMMQGHQGFAARLAGSEAIVALNNELQLGLAQVGFSTPRKEDDYTNVKKFLGRMLGLSCRLQNT